MPLSNTPAAAWPAETAMAPREKQAAAALTANRWNTFMVKSLSLVRALAEMPAAAATDPKATFGRRLSKRRAMSGKSLKLQEFRTAGAAG
ncbi:hypothetical protein GCM10009099_06760 [Caenispirillum bisanense]